MKEKGKRSYFDFWLCLVFFSHVSQQKLPHSVKIKQCSYFLKKGGGKREIERH